MTMKDTISATEQEQAVRQLMTELEKGRKSGETEGWLTPGQTALSEKSI